MLNQSIYGISIYNNSELSSCKVQSICDYLSFPNANITIGNNSTGCNTAPEVEEACLVEVPNNCLGSELTIYPNPTKNHITITSNNGVPISEVTIYNQLSQKVLQQTRMANTIDVSTLQQGIYIIEITSDKLKIREKLIIN